MSPRRAAALASLALVLGQSHGAPAPAPAPPAPGVRTCAAGSSAKAAKYCDTSLSMEARAAALVSELTLTEKLNTFMLVGQLRGVPRLNIKQFRWVRCLLGSSLDAPRPEEASHRGVTAL